MKMVHFFTGAISSNRSAPNQVVVLVNRSIQPDDAYTGIGNGIGKTGTKFRILPARRVTDARNGMPSTTFPISQQDDNETDRLSEGVERSRKKAIEEWHS